MGKVDKGDMPPVLDVEDPKQFAGLSANDSVALIKQWLDGVQAKLGVRPMLYMSSSFSRQVLGDSPQLNPYQLWVADWTTAKAPIVDNPPWTSWTFWQHANNGRVPGIQGDVDLDYFNGAPAQLKDVNQPPAPPTTDTQPHN
jgi:lysozyme